MGNTDGTHDASYCPQNPAIWFLVMLALYSVQIHMTGTFHVSLKADFTSTLVKLLSLLIYFYYPSQKHGLTSYYIPHLGYYLKRGIA